MAFLSFWSKHLLIGNVTEGKRLLKGGQFGIDQGFKCGFFFCHGSRISQYSEDFRVAYIPVRLLHHGERHVGGLHLSRWLGQYPDRRRKTNSAIFVHTGDGRQRT